MITYTKKPNNSNALQVIANNAGIKFAKSGTSEFVYDYWVELEGHRLSKKALNRFARMLILECNTRVENYISECGEIASLPESVLMGYFELGE